MFPYNVNSEDFCTIFVACDLMINDLNNEIKWTIIRRVNSFETHLISMNTQFHTIRGSVLEAKMIYIYGRSKWSDLPL